MKAEALYHLLMARARAIAPAGDGPGNAFLGEMRDTLAVTWTWTLPAAG